MSDVRMTMKDVNQLLSDPNSIQNDLTEAMEMVKEHLHKKYINKIMMAVEDCNTSVQHNPSDEVKFLKALKPFAKETSKEQIDGFIDIMQKFHAINEMRNGFVPKPESRSVQISSQSFDNNSSVHKDGIYDIDKNCLSCKSGQDSNINGLGGMLLAMSLVLKK